MRPCEEVEFDGHPFFSICIPGKPEEMTDPDTGIRFERTNCVNCLKWIDDLVP